MMVNVYRIFLLSINLSLALAQSTSPQCPSSEDQCSSLGVTYYAGKTGAPNCWYKTPGSSTWQCFDTTKSPTSCDPRVGFIDTLKCNFSGDAVQDNCPASQAWCLDANYKAYYSYDKKAPKCWTKAIGGYYCRQDSNDGQCQPGEINLATCGSGNTPLAPTGRDRCYTRNGSTYNLNQNAPPCWRKYYGNWFCESFISSGSCSSNSYDISPLVRTRPSSCPTKKNYCFDGKGKYFLATSSNAPPCWSFTFNRWYCSGFESSGTCSTNSIPVSGCINKSTCPKNTDICKDYLYKEFKAYSSNAPPCWGVINGQWRCGGYDGLGKCYTGYVDTNPCGQNIKPTCPSRNVKCADDRGRVFNIGENDTPPCWSGSVGTWKCSGFKQDDMCDTNSIDINSCFKVNPGCPRVGETCYDNQFKTYNSRDSSSPPCWIKYSGVWRCGGYDVFGSCYTGYYDTNICFKYYGLTRNL